MILGTACSGASHVMGEIAERMLNIPQVTSYDHEYPVITCTCSDLCVVCSPTGFSCLCSGSAHTCLRIIGIAIIVVIEKCSALLTNASE